MASRKLLKRARSPELPSFIASKKLRNSINNQTKVAMETTKQLILIEGKEKNMVDEPLSKKLRNSINNQTKVAMEITKQLLLIEGKEKNMVYSPLSIHVVLSMIAAGTKGPAMEQLLSFLKSKFISELNDLASNLVPLVFEDGSPSGGPRLSFANSVWVEESVSIKTSFKEVVDFSYKAALKQVDFKARYEKVRCEVNSWVEKETNGLINGIIPKSSVNSATRLILANALYFKGAWDKKFDASQTRKLDFHLLNGSSIKAPFMTNSKEQYVRAFDGFKVLRLPYEQGLDYERRFSMYVFLPNARDGLPALVERVSSESGFLDRHIPNKCVPVRRFLFPKFKICSYFDCIKVLENLGLKIFKLPCLTEMVRGTALFVKNIHHKSFIEVNEEGTEAAAAATVVIVKCGGSRKPPPLIDFEADHPFLFLIREEVTGTVLFVGHVLNPIK